MVKLHYFEVKSLPIAGGKPSLPETSKLKFLLPEVVLHLNYSHFSALTHVKNFVMTNFYFIYPRLSECHPHQMQTAPVND